MHFIFSKISLKVKLKWFSLFLRLNIFTSLLLDFLFCISDLGAALPMKKKVKEKMTEFVIRYVYNDKVSCSLHEARAFAWRKMKKKYTQRLPPDEDSLR